jgi:sugar phosphate isomerase/epimerase
MDMGLPDAAEVFQKRMEFAKTLGAGIIITNTSHIENERQFFKNMELLSGIADDLELTIALENPGDGRDYIMANAADGARIVEQLDSGWVKLNYDFSNIHTLSKGKNTYDTGLGGALPYIAHLHLKNVKLQGGSWVVCSLEEGIINYKALFHEYPALKDVPMSIELPVRFGYDREFNFVLMDMEQPPLERISKMLHDSLVFLDNSII